MLRRAVAYLGARGVQTSSRRLASQSERSRALAEVLATSNRPAAEPIHAALFKPARTGALGSLGVRGIDSKVARTFASMAVRDDDRFRSGLRRIATTNPLESKGAGLEGCAVFTGPGGTATVSLVMGLRRRAYSAESGKTAGTAADPKQEGNISKFKTMLRKYGPLFVVFYGGVYLTTLGSLYLCIDQGLIDSSTIVDFLEQYVHLLEQYGLDKILSHEGRIDKAGNFAIAWIAAKFTEPIRFAVSVYCVPKLARFLKLV